MRNHVLAIIKKITSSVPTKSGAPPVSVGRSDEVEASAAPKGGTPSTAAVEFVLEKSNPGRASALDSATASSEEAFPTVSAGTAVTIAVGPVIEAIGNAFDSLGVAKTSNPGVSVAKRSASATGVAEAEPDTKRSASGSTSGFDTSVSVYSSGNTGASATGVAEADNEAKAGVEIDIWAFRFPTSSAPNMKAFMVASHLNEAK
ncbi:hypothetical protein K458DRAFT_403565 [Lentithecium fluviatile CBS 122367]|uniref:Uncharacterized protein n=1 Tax=Lentithecium fluviatile CBS 122367 TaxID=1168545 RepID=A0A6G1J553_9PLEO|nr:hypothetical protein K458DRAFT_403565 [Lentithecium fluviatile CBS 122367]